MQWKRRGGGAYPGSIIIDIRGFEPGDALRYYYHCRAMLRARAIIEKLLTEYDEVLT